jgi:hypothetical protein
VWSCATDDEDNGRWRSVPELRTLSIERGVRVIRLELKARRPER